MIEPIQTVINHCCGNPSDFFEGVSLCRDWVDLTFGNSFPKEGKNFFCYISIWEDTRGWGKPFKKVGNLATFFSEGKWHWERGIFIVLKVVRLTAEYTIISCRDVFQLKINNLSRVEWIADAAGVPLKIKKVWDKGWGTGSFGLAQAVGSGLSVVFSVVKLFDTKKSVVLAWMDVSLSTTLFAAELFKAKKQSRETP